MEGGGYRQAPAALLTEINLYSFYGRLGGSQGRSGLVWKISSPSGFDPRTAQLVVFECNLIKHLQVPLWDGYYV